MLGEWQDFVVHPDGSEELVDEGQNLVVNTAYVAIAMAMKLDPAFGGFMYWAVGDGNTSDSAAWDAGVQTGMIAPTKADTALLRETVRKAIQPSDIVFIDAAGNVSATPTNRLQLTVTFMETDPVLANGEISYFREWGIFGGNATAAANSGFLINHKVHKTYEKTNSSQLKRVLKFTF